MPHFFASSSNVRLDTANGGCVLIASCTRYDQTSSESRLDLNQFFANYDGNLAAVPNGGFSHSAQNIHLEEDKLVCTLQKCDQTWAEPIKFDLNAVISNHDGQLVWDGREYEIKIRHALPNVSKMTHKDGPPQLWDEIDTSVASAVLSGTFVTNEGQKFIGQSPFKLDSNTFIFGATEEWLFKMASVDSQGNLIESRHISKEEITDLSNLTASIWNAATQMPEAPFYYQVIDVITTLSIPAKVRITRPLSLGTTGGNDPHGIHHLHINNLEVYDQAGAKLTLVYNGNASQDVAQGHDGSMANGVSCTPAMAIDGDGTTGNISTFSHDAFLPHETTNAYGTQDHWMEFDVSEGHPSSIFIRNNHVSERLAGSTLAVLDSKGSSMEEFTLTAEKLQQYDLTDTRELLGVSASLELTWVDQGWGHRKGHLYARKGGGAWVGVSTHPAEHERTRESFEIPAKLLGGKLELGVNVGNDGGHELTITHAAVEITEKRVTRSVKVNDPHD